MSNFRFYRAWWRYPTEKPVRTSALTLVGLPVTASMGHHTVRAFASRRPSLARSNSVWRSKLIRVAGPTPRPRPPVCDCDILHPANVDYVIDVTEHVDIRRLHGNRHFEGLFRFTQPTPPPRPAAHSAFPAATAFRLAPESPALTT